MRVLLCALLCALARAAPLPEERANSYDPVAMHQFCDPTYPSSLRAD